MLERNTDLVILARHVRLPDFIHFEFSRFIYDDEEILSLDNPNGVLLLVLTHQTGGALVNFRRTWNSL